MRQRLNAAKRAAAVPTVETAVEASIDSTHLWAPTWRQAWILLVIVRILGTLWYGLISDCDETFNYWEPTHMLLYGRGLQTWEYAPQYALRSYAYAGFHALLAFMAGGAWGADKVAVFHGTRLLLAVICATCESIFYRGILKQFGGTVATYALTGLMASAGMLHAAPAYLPSTFTMYGLLVAWGAWMARHTVLAVWAAVLGLACGWPFAVVALVPLALHVGLTQCISWVGLSKVMKGKAMPWAVITAKGWRIVFHAFASLFAILSLQSLIDHSFYSTWLIAPWNIIKYNALGQGGGGQGSDLYGVEPASFYAKNIALNFNVVGLLAAASPIAVAWSAYKRSHGWDFAVAAVGQLLLWLAAMWPRPHKEERFLFVVYPLFPLAAAFTLQWADGVLSSLWRRVSGSKEGARATISRTLAVLLLVVAAALSGMRIAALVDSFSAPFSAWAFLSHHLKTGQTGKEWPYVLAPHAAVPPAATVCVGKEWYRFPASFFLPEHSGRTGGPAQLSFLKSGFGGLLPQPYLAPPIFNATSAYRKGYNDENREEKDRYVPWQACDYVVDFQTPTPRSAQEGAKYEPYFDRGALLRPGQECACSGGNGDKTTTVWRSLYSLPFLHADSSPALSRALYIPGYSRTHNVYGTYHVIKKDECRC